MARRDGDDLSLFDLPLDPGDDPEDTRPGDAGGDGPAREPGEAGGEPRQAGEPQLLDLSPPELPEPRPEGVETAADDGTTDSRPAPVPAPFTSRLAASLLDGGVLLTGAALALVGGYLLHVGWDRNDLPALALFVAVFSFVYSVVPLAFWGRTPGMALMRVVARGADGGPLTFGQTALRWLAGVLTVAMAGLPLLLALAGRSPADLVSGSRTWLLPPSPPQQ